LDFLDI